MTTTEKLLTAAESAANWLCDAPKGSDPFNRGKLLAEAITGFIATKQIEQNLGEQCATCGCIVGAGCPV